MKYQVMIKYRTARPNEASDSRFAIGGPVEGENAAAAVRFYLDHIPDDAVNVQVSCSVDHDFEAYEDFLGWSRTNVSAAKGELYDLAKALDVGDDQILEIRAIFARLMFGLGLSEMDLARLIIQIMVVIAQDNLHKKADEAGQDD